MAAHWQSLVRQNAYNDCPNAAGTQPATAPSQAQLESLLAEAFSNYRCRASGRGSVIFTKIFIAETGCEADL